MEVLFLDTVHNALPDLFEKAGFKNIFYHSMKSGSLDDYIENIDGIIVRSKFKIDKKFLNKKIP